MEQIPGLVHWQVARVRENQSDTTWFENPSYAENPYLCVAMLAHYRANRKCPDARWTGDLNIDWTGFDWDPHYRLYPYGTEGDRKSVV